MAVRLGCFTRTIPSPLFTLLFPSYHSYSHLMKATLPNSSSQSPNQVEGDEPVLNAISITKQKAGDDLGITSCNSKKLFSSGSKNNSSAKESGSSSSVGSIDWSNESDFGKKCYLPCVSSKDTSGTAQLELKLGHDDGLLYNKGFKGMLEEHSLPTSFGKKESARYNNRRSAKTSLKAVTRRTGRKSSKYQRECFDICLSAAERSEIRDSERGYISFQRCSPNTEDNTEVIEEVMLIEKPTQGVLRPGMVLLKNYISPTEQISIVGQCRKLGLGPGGFYRPGYKDGSKLRLQMMCLGLDWDPQTRKYQKRRRIDKAKPPNIPSEFQMLVTRAMQDSLSLIKEDSKVCNAVEILPRMTPDICIINFYTENGRLGLHQDRDESEESLSKGLPVVSFSVGDAAEFLYSDQRDANKAEKLVLESGDVLIFGGESRHVFHGVSSIIPHSAPPYLLEEAGLCPGRLNLTFRQH